MGDESEAPKVTHPSCDGYLDMRVCWKSWPHRATQGILIQSSSSLQACVGGGPRAGCAALQERDDETAPQVSVLFVEPGNGLFRANES